MRRRLYVSVAAIVIVAVAVWLASKPIARFDLGAGEALVARPGVNVLLVGDGRGGWTLFDAASRRAEDGRPLTGPPAVGLPAVAVDGAVWVLTGDGLDLHTYHASVRTTIVSLSDLPAGAALVGVPGGGSPVLSAPDGDAAALHEVVADRRVADGPPSGRLSAITAAGRAARAPAGAPVLASTFSRALAFRGADGWEAWSAGPGGWRRVVAPGHDKPAAAFAPDGERLVIEGRVDGLWLLDLADGGLEFMGVGDLGHSRRVANAPVFLREPAPVLLAGQWTLDGRLHLTWSHLGGGGRTQMKLGLFHDYAPALSWDGDLLVYRQGEFDEQGEGPFDEALYCMDRNQPDQLAVFVDSRTGGLPDQGPLFVGTSDAFVYVADGEVRGVVFPQPSVKSPP